MGGTEQLVATMAVQTPNRIGNEQLDLLAYRRLALLIDGAVFVLFRWHRSCQAYRAMIVLAACDFRRRLDCWRPGAALRVAKCPHSS